ncbi:MAG TPA: MFS transporter [Stellaceae bacterium]|jgi:ACS family glucarate transporter-like MFS transporter|nr:MFS transporter [Stellaceae bacterium]
MSAVSATQPQKRGYRRYWVYLFMLTLIMINYIDRTAVSIVAKPIATEFDLSPVQMGYLFSTFLWTYTVCLLPIGILVDRHGPRSISAWGIAIWSVAIMATAGAWNLATFVTTRLVMGVGEATSVPAAGRMIREWAPAGERGTASAIWGTGSILGSAIGAATVGAAASEWGWRGAFLVLGVLGFVWLIASLIWLDRPEKVKWLSDEERRRILTERGARPNEDVTARGHAGALGPLLRSPAMWGAMSVHAASIYMLYLLMFWMPSYLQTTKHLSIMSTGLYTAAPWAIAVPVAIVFGILSDKFLNKDGMNVGKRRWPVVGCLLIGALVVFVPMANDMSVILGIFAVALAGINAGYSLNTALVTDLVRQPTEIGKAIMLLVLSANVCGLLAPIVTGYVIQSTGQYDGGFYIAGVLLVVAAIAVGSLTRRPILEGDDVRALEQVA